MSGDKITLFLSIVTGLIAIGAAYWYYFLRAVRFTFSSAPLKILLPLAFLLISTEVVIMELIAIITHQDISLLESMLDATVLLFVTFPFLYFWMRQQNEQIKTIVSNIADATVVINQHGEIEYFNLSAERIFGYKAIEVIGKKVNILMPEPHRTEHDKYLYRYLSTHDPHVLNKGRINLTAIKKNGDEFPIYIAINNMFLYGREFFVASIQDFSEQKAAEEKMRLSEEKFRNLFNHTADAIFVADTQTGMIVDTNTRASELIGRSREEILTLHQTQLHPPEELEDIAAKFQQAVQSPTPITVEAHALHKAGKIIPVEISTSFYSDNEGKIKLIGVFRDVTDRKLAEKKILQLNADFSATLQAIPDLLFELDKNGLYINVWAHNPELLAAQRELLIGHTVKEMLPAKAAGAIMDSIRESDEQGSSYGKIIELDLLPDGTKWFELSTSKKEVSDETGSRFIMLSRDITERILSENKIKDREARLKEAEQIGHLGHWDWNIVTNDLYWSDEIYRIFGLTPQQFGASYPAFLETIHPDDRDNVVNAVNDAVTGKSEYSIEHRIVLPDGQTRVVHEQGNVSRDPDGKPLRMIGIVHDITERKEYENALEKIKDAALDASRAKSDFLANMSHEIRTPMNTTLGVGELLKETELTPEQRKYVDMFQKSGEHLLTLINDILDLSKIEAGHMELENIDFNLLSVVEEVRSILAPKATEKGVEFIIALDEAIPSNLIGDPHRLRQVLINLAGNSLKFTSKGSITINVKFDKALNSHVRIVFEVKDTGIGIPKDKLDRLFQNFTQVDSSTTRQYGGTGLGLVISKKIVEMMDGHIWVESEAGQGSSFFFDVVLEVSRQIIEEKKTSGRSDSEITKSLNSQDIRILLVEDSEDNRQLIKLYMKGFNMTLDEAENGEVALDKLKNHKYDIVFMDIQMPVMDGYEATRLYRKWEKQENIKPVPIIGLSANAFKDDREKAIRAGCTNYLTKPVRKKQLLEMVVALILDK